MVSALRRGTWLDRFAIGFSLTGASLQLYFVGGVLLLIFTYQLGIAPGAALHAALDNPVDWASGLVLAWVALAFLFSAIYARLSRAQMLETMSEDFVRTARAKGLPRSPGVRPARAARGDHPAGHHRRAGRRRRARRHRDHRDDLRPAGAGTHGGRRRARRRPADDHGHRADRRRPSSSSPTSSSTCSTLRSTPGFGCASTRPTGPHRLYRDEIAPSGIDSLTARSRRQTGGRPCDARAAIAARAALRARRGGERLQPRTRGTPRRPQRTARAGRRQQTGVIATDPQDSHGTGRRRAGRHQGRHVHHHPGEQDLATWTRSGSTPSPA